MGRTRDSAGEGDDPVRCDASKEVDASRLAIGFAHVLRGVYGIDSLWLHHSKISLLRDIGSIVGDSYGHGVDAHATASETA